MTLLSHSSTAPAPLLAAFLVEGIELGSPIGRGGSSTVWSGAWKGRAIAIKVLDEGRAAARPPALDHPHVLKVLREGSVLGRRYYVSERVAGDLRALLREGPLGRALWRPVLVPLLDALAHAHQRGVVHGDLKPGNVLVDPASRPVRTLLTDFGQGVPDRDEALAASLLSQDRADGSYATLAYLAPERAAGGPPTVQSDLFAFGVLLFEVLTGRLPRGLELPSELNAAVDRRLDALVKRCLARDPSRRPASADALRRDVLRLLPRTSTRAVKRAPAKPEQGMVLIPAGTLVIGERDVPNSAPMHERQVGAFWIDRAPVTQRDYLSFVLATGAARLPGWPARGRLRPEQLDLPVTRVTCEEAQAYARWRGKRLLTEFEWERAAQGPEQRSFPYGEVFEPERVARTLSPTGTVPTSEGVCDLTGNGWEWTASPFGPYPEPSAATEVRVLRGGFDRRGVSNAHVRAGLRRDGRDRQVTFRCARDA